MLSEHSDYGISTHNDAHSDDPKSGPSSILRYSFPSLCISPHQYLHEILLSSGFILLNTGMIMITTLPSSYYTLLMSPGVNTVDRHVLTEKQRMMGGVTRMKADVASVLIKEE